MIALGLYYLKIKKIIHKDIKPENIFQFENGVIKLGDFGLSRKQIMYSQLKTKSNSGTHPYMSPEQHTIDEVTQTYNITYQTDAWSLGIIIHELIAGKKPFEDIDDIKLAQKIKFDEVPQMESKAS